MKTLPLRWEILNEPPSPEMGIMETFPLSWEHTPFSSWEILLPHREVVKASL